MKTPYSFRFGRLFVGVASVGAALVLAVAHAATTASPAKQIRVAFIAKGQQDVFWKSVHAGASTAEAEANTAGQNVKLLWDAPTSDGDSPAQLALLENYINQKPDGIILCPIDSNALVAPAQKARRAGIPLEVADSTLDFKDIVAFVGTDNFKGGQMAGEELARLLGDKGNVILLRYNSGSASCTAREEGFLDAIKKHKGITVISDNNFAGTTRESALEKSSNLLNSFSGKVDGVFTPNESSTNGMMLALEGQRLAGKIKFVGFDGGSKNMEGLNAGHINALVLQNPYRMGYLGVKTMLDKIAGKDVPTNVDTGATLVTKENLTSAPVVELLKNTVTE